MIIICNKWVIRIFVNHKMLYLIVKIKYSSAKIDELLQNLEVDVNHQFPKQNNVHNRFTDIHHCYHLQFAAQITANKHNLNGRVSMV